MAHSNSRHGLLSVLATDMGNALAGFVKKGGDAHAVRKD